jgi:hypothetical protein
MIEIFISLLLNLAIYNDSIIKNEVQFKEENKAIINSEDSIDWDIVVTDDDNPHY